MATGPWTACDDEYGWNEYVLGCDVQYDTDAKGRSVTRYRSGVETTYVAHKKTYLQFSNNKQTILRETIHTKKIIVF